MKIAAATGLWAVFIWQLSGEVPLKFDLTISLGTIMTIGSMIGSMVLIWFRFGRYAEGAMRDIASLLKWQQNQMDFNGTVTETLGEIKNLVGLQDQRLESQEAETLRIREGRHALRNELQEQIVISQDRLEQRMNRLEDRK